MQVDIFKKKKEEETDINQINLDRIQQAANIFGTTAGRVPGAPVQPFQVNPTYAGIGAFGNLQAMLGAKT